MGKIGWLELILIAVLVLILFGHAKIPELAKNLASGINVFKKELKGDKESVKRNQESEALTPKRAVAKKTSKNKVAKKNPPKK